ncbi:MAG TPA: metallophosphoesterase, partial [Polyangiaceae bacterium]
GFCLHYRDFHPFSRWRHAVNPPAFLVKHNATLAPLAIIWFGFACTDVADDRAERDESVGQYRDASTRIAVDAGLAVVRSVQPDMITLWSSAPAWSATIERLSATALTIDIRNQIPDSALTVTDAEGTNVAVRHEFGAFRTRSRYVIESPPSRLRLQLTPPRAEQPLAYRFAVLGDIQEAIDRVQDIYRRIATEPELEFVICPGDWTQRGTREQLTRFEQELEPLPIPFYGTLGNHELGTNPPPYQELFGRGNLHFHHRGIAFSLLDSGSAMLAPRSMDWLRDWLNEDQERVHVFVTHFPPIDPIGVRNGSFASRAEAHQLLARLAEGRVDLNLHGHIHSYYAFIAAGIPSYISGGGGAIPERFDQMGRHFLVVQLRGGEGTDSGVDSVRVVRVD